MPYRKRYGKRKFRRPYRGKRSYKRRRYSGFRTSTMLSGLPGSRSARLRYNEVIAITCNTGILAGYVFRANSCFDPNLTSTGHQPMGFDTWAGLYNHYTVVGSKITAVVMQKQDNSAPCMCGLYLSDGSTAAFTTPSEYKEAKRGVSKVFGGYQASGKAFVSSTFSAKKFFNIADIKDNWRTLGAAVTANPTEDAFFHFWYATLDGTTESVVVSFTIDYLVTFHEPVDMGQS